MENERRLRKCVCVIFTLLVLTALLGVMLFEPEIVNRAAGGLGPDQQLIFAAGDRDVHAMGQALAAGANVNARTSAGINALSLACSSGDVQVVRMLIDHGADLDQAPNHQCSPVHLAVAFDHVEVVELLLDHGAKPNPTCNRLTPLDTADEFHREPIAKILRAHGAKHGVALHVAVATRH